MKAKWLDKTSLSWSQSVTGKFVAIGISVPVFLDARHAQTTFIRWLLFQYDINCLLNIGEI